MCSSDLSKAEVDQPWFICSFSPTAAFEEVKPLFDRELELLNAGDSEEDAWEEIMGQIDALKLRLTEAENGNNIEEFLLHIQNDEAWFRY